MVGRKKAPPKYPGLKLWNLRLHMLSYMEKDFAGVIKLKILIKKKKKKD